MNQSRHVDTKKPYLVRPFLYVALVRSDLHSHTSAKLRHNCWIWLNPTCVLLRLENSQNCSISHIDGGPRSGPTATHACTRNMSERAPGYLAEIIEGVFTICHSSQRQKIKFKKRKSMNVMRSPTFCPNSILAVSVTFHGLHWLALPPVHLI